MIRGPKDTGFQTLGLATNIVAGRVPARARPTPALSGHWRQYLGELAGRAPASGAAADPAPTVRCRCHPYGQRRLLGQLRGPAVLGALRLGWRLRDLASIPVDARPLDLDAALAEVAR